MPQYAINLLLAGMNILRIIKNIWKKFQNPELKTFKSSNLQYAHKLLMNRGMDDSILVHKGEPCFMLNINLSERMLTYCVMS